MRLLLHLSHNESVDLAEQCESSARIQARDVLGIKSAMLRNVLAQVDLLLRERAS